MFRGPHSPRKHKASWQSVTKDESEGKTVIPFFCLMDRMSQTRTGVAAVAAVAAIDVAAVAVAAIVAVIPLL